ncbi:MAG: hypothetical protein LKG80_06490 [Lachnospiraceae bacterium]|jgi:hypothetical protein|nr:hypothetical protein [Lachnospiraceae bacterium]MCH4031784.1 hypothetical protein [Lachnospiraceae bacterium]MCH4108338.1 hypothetical protein [Lachnospiraceae bacterium]MCI1380808.1 hypothetical protein [Lachnospiraceae bacterium]MCI1401428.1 hypothetical protein [Lachnospiraceae bacterium]
MDILEIAKSAFKIAQASDNIELQRKILEIQEQAMALQQKNYELQNELNILKHQQEIEEKIERHPDPYITLKDDPQHIAYCATCWATKHQLIQMWHNGKGILNCPSCKSGFSTDYREKVDHLSPRGKIG